MPALKAITVLSDQSQNYHADLPGVDFLGVFQVKTVGCACCGEILWVASHKTVSTVRKDE